MTTETKPAGAGSTGTAGTTPAAGTTTPPATGTQQTTTTPPTQGTPAKAPEGQGAKPTSFVAGAAGGEPEKQEGSGQQGTDGQAPAPGLDGLKLPEGGGIDPDLFEGFKSIAKESKVGAEQAQALVDWFAKEAGRKSAEATAAAEKEFAQKLESQKKALEADPHIGGANLEKSLEVARRAVVKLDRQFDGLGSKVAKEIDAAGLGNSPALSRLLVVIGEKMLEDRTGEELDRAGERSPDEVRARKRYPNTLADK